MSNSNLNRYDFIEGQEFIPKTYGVIISPDDNIISVTGDGALLGVVKLDIEKNIISLIGKDGTKFSSAELPLVDVISDAYYDEEQMALIIKVVLSDGNEKEIVVPFNDLLEDYAKKADVEKNTEAIVDINEDIIELSKNIANEIDNRQTADSEINEKLDKKVEWTDVSTEENPNRKSIVLNNHDTILGKDTKGGTVNIAMVSKWDKVDLGSTSLEINLNGSAEHLTYNDSEELAFVKDIDNLKTNIDNTIQELKDKDSDLQRQINLISGTEGELTKELDALKAKDVILENKDIELEQSIEEEKSVRSEKDTELQGNIEAEASERIKQDGILKTEIDNEILARSEKDTELQGNIEAEATERIKQIEEINEKLDKKVEWTDVSTEENPNRKSIVLENHDTILGKDTNGEAANIAMVSKWNKVDLGSAKLEINLNGSAEHPTYNDSEELAFVSDITSSSETISKEIEDLKNKDIELEEKITNEITDRENTDKLIQEELTNLKDKAVQWTDIHTEDLPNRKSIVLENHDLILGKDTKGGSVNIAMVSKWDKVDLGSASLEINLNGKEERPTYNDNKTIALIDDINNATQSIKLIKKNELEYTLMVGENEAGSIVIPKDQFLKSVNYETETQELVFIFETVEGENTIRIDMSELVDTYKAGLGLNLQDNTFNVIIDNTSETNKYLQVSEQGLKIVGIDEKFAQYTPSDNLNENFATKVELSQEISRAKGEEAKLLGTEADSEEIISLYGVKKYASINQGEITNINIKIDTIDSKFNGYVTKAEAVQQHDEVLSNSKLYTDNKISEEKPSIITESVNQSKTYTDSKITPLNETITSNTDRITNVEDRCDHFDDLFGMILDEHGEPVELKFYTKSEIDSKVETLNSKDNLLASKIAVLEEKLAKLSKTNIEEISLNEGSGVSFDDETKDYVVSGSETKSTTIVGKTVKLDNLTITNNARTNIKASDVELKGVQLSGDFPKDNGNAVISINNAEYIVIKDMEFDSSNVYNGIEIGLSSETLPKSILFENCKFLGKFSNNAILIFGTQNNAVINIDNCYFEDLSNPIRLSNNTNVKCTLNITNCKVDKWDVNSPWQGLLIMQDYTSGDAEQANINNLFAPEKITINVINCIGPNNKKITMPTDISTICGTGDDKQVFYVWDNYRNLVSYDETKYPKINIL